MSDQFWENLVQGKPLVPERWRWTFALPWFLLGLLLLWISSAFPQGLSGLLPLYAAAFFLTAFTRWSVWKWQKPPRAFRRLYVFYLPIPTALVLHQWDHVMRRPDWIKALLAVLLLIIVVQLLRFVRAGEYRHYFAAFVGLYHVNLLLETPVAASTSHAPWFTLIEGFSTWIVASIIFAEFVFPRDLLPRSMRSKLQNLWEPQKP